ncbi:hypothetical protein GCM10011322_28090 [Salinarimonas ramus]|uniref:Uncharacterized protein n=1 Tax=Salinarimonas ramus TaxID=690164 RepID=A0A917QAD1_9HYPH|nr:hypothetical protein GCM10011322_28090 [Salinarimonas ramus]
MGLLSPQPATAQDGGFFREVFGAIGLVEPDQPDIQYRERAPLVVPPNLGALPPPVEGGVAEANPQWPNDPDVAAARARAIEANTPAPERGGAFEGIGRRMTPEELRAGRVPGAGLGGPVRPEWEPAERGFGGANANPAWIPPDTLRRLDEERRAAAPETRLQRRFLTDPPQAYLAPDPAAAFPERVDTFTGPRPEPQSATDFVRDQNARQ